uniref:C2 domain-containing protein n=1 Tax=Kalanchoe fedtschenkoi TaxID=63787 RepID=A0A7N0TRW1_KALFE
MEDPVVRPLAEQDSQSLERLLPEIPLWVKNPDYDRVDWINKFLDYKWPYLDKAICKMVENIAKPIIDEQKPKYKIESVEFEALSLGSLPPTFQGEKHEVQTCNHIKRIKKNRNPRWEEEFQFTVEEPPVNDKLHVEVYSSSSRIGILHPKESLGYVDISLADVVNNKRINEKYHLIDSKNGRIQIELQWRTSS